MATEAEALGRLGEDLAARYLEGRGFRILVRRYQNARGYRLGEIDLIGLWQGSIRFIEVKTSLFRAGAGQAPELRISPDKLRRMARLSGYYLRERGLSGEKTGFDAVTVLYDPTKRRAFVRLLPDVFF
jgi:putative endonuclease